MSLVSYAWQNMLSEITLVLLTTIAPSAILAYVVMMGRLFIGPSLSDDTYKTIRKMLWIPLAICMVGLVASATHLGNPANALYVLSRVGFSPLSNEVFSLSIFLGLAAIFWIAGFAVQRHRVFDFVIVILLVVSSVVALAFMSRAYSVDTIPTWNNVAIVPTVAVSAGIVGPLLANVCMGKSLSYNAWKAAVTVSIVCGILWISLHVYVGVQLPSIQSTLFSASMLVPMYMGCIAASSVLLVASWALTTAGVRRASYAMQITAIVLGYSSIFIMRMMFYMTHMTVGIAF